jgi:hypothetical protein
VCRKAAQCNVDNELLFHYITIALCVLLRSELYNIITTVIRTVDLTSNIARKEDFGSDGKAFCVSVGLWFESRHGRRLF